MKISANRMRFPGTLGRIVLGCHRACRAKAAAALGIVLGLLWHSGLALADKPAAVQRPNILLIVAEDLSSQVGSFGDKLALTPNIDELAQQGLRYSHAFTASGVCSVSRSALITGVQPISMGTQHHPTGRRRPVAYEAVPPAEIKAFPELLRRAGYATANFAKKDYQFGEPFTIWDVDEGNFLTEEVPPIWRKLDTDKPFFAMINLMVTHESRLMPPGVKVNHPFGKNIEALAKRRAEIVKAVTPAGKIAVPAYYPDTAPVRENLAQMYDNVHHMDKQVGQLLKQLKEDGLDKNTLVIWTTDHGNGTPRAKRSVYDSGVKVPMVLRFPDGKRAGEVEKKLVSFVDVAPTILQLAGAEVPDYIQGENFLAPGKQREYIYASRDRMDETLHRVRLVRGPQYAYIRNYDHQQSFYKTNHFRDMFPIMQALLDGRAANSLSPAQAYYFQEHRSEEELYDTLADPEQLNNLAGKPEYKKVLARMAKAMDAWLNKVGDLSDIPEEQLIQRMWPNNTQPITAAPKVAVKRGKFAIHSDTPGASIGYRVKRGEKLGPWQLYTQPVKLPKGSNIEAKAVRYGYKESEVVTAQN